MGWLFSHHSRRELIAALIKTDDTENYQHVTLAHALRGNVLWSVVQSTPKDPAKTSHIVIHCTLMQGSAGSWGYKAMDESVHPCYYSCPKRWPRRSARNGVKRCWHIINGVTRNRV